VHRAEAWKRIAAGVRRFQSEVFPAQRQLFERLRKGQEPVALFLTCADSRVVPNLITQTGPGELFVERNPGNMVPPYSEFVGGVTSGVEYANLVLKVPLIIVCGHTDCGVMKALLHPEIAAGLPGVQQWMRHGSQARQIILRDHAELPDENRISALTRANVLEQIANLTTHPSVASRLSKDEVLIVGWVYDIGDGSIWQAVPETGKFELFGGG